MPCGLRFKLVLPVSDQCGKRLNWLRSRCGSLPMSNTAFPQKGELASLDGKVAIITGAAKGIGLGCARVLGAAGAAIAAVDIDESALQQATQQLRENGVSAEPYCANVSSREAVDTAIQAIGGRFGRLD